MAPHAEPQQWERGPTTGQEAARLRGANDDEAVGARLGAPDLSVAAEQLADVGAVRSRNVVKRSVAGTKRTIALAPKSVSQTTSRSST